MDACENTRFCDPSSETFTAAGSMSNARAYHAAVMLWNGRMIVAGGSPASSTNSKEAVATAEVSQ